MFKSVGSIANGIVLVLFIVSIGAFSLIRIQGQPMFQIMRNVMLAALGEPTNGIRIEGRPTEQTLECDYQTGVCNWR